MGTKAVAPAASFGSILRFAAAEAARLGRAVVGAAARPLPGLRRGGVPPERRRTDGPRRTLVLTPEVPHPVFKGNQNRIDLTIRSLLEQGDEVHLAVLNRNQPGRRSGDIARELAAAYPGLGRVAVCRHPRLKRRHPNFWLNAALGWLEERLGRRDLVSNFDTAPVNFRRAVRRLARAVDPDVLFVNYLHLAKAVPARTRAARVVDTHDVHALIQSEHRRVNPNARAVDLERIAACEVRQADRFDVIIAINEDEAAHFRRRCRARVETVAASVHPDSLRGPFAHDLLFVGSSSPFNIDALLKFDAESWPILRARFPELRIAVVGDVGLAAAMRKLDRRNYDILGRVSDADLARIYALSRIVICPLRAGAGTKIKVVEAFAHGKAVVLTPAAAAGLTFRRATDAVVAEPGAPFAEAVASVLTDDGLRRRLEANGRLFFDRHHSETVVADGLRRAVAGCGPAPRLLAAPGERAALPVPAAGASPRGLVFAMDARSLMDITTHLGALLRAEGCAVEFLKGEPTHFNYFARQGFPVRAVKPAITDRHRRFADDTLRRLRVGGGDLPESLVVDGVEFAEEIRVHRRMFPQHFEGDKAARSVRWALVLHAALRDLCDELRPDFLVGWNGSGPHLIYLMKLLGRARGLPVFHVERGFFPGTYVFDPRGVNYRGLLAGGHVAPPREDELAAALAFRARFRERGRTVVDRGDAGAGPERVRRALGLGADEGFVLLPGQIEGDSNLVLNSPAFQTMGEVLDRLHPAAGRAGLRVVFRPHPETEYAPEYLDDLRRRGVVVDRDAHLHALIRASAAVATINSTAGLEALMYGRPTLVLGNAVYGGKGFTFDVRAEDEIGAALAEAARGGGWDARRDRLFLGFLHEVAHRYLLYAGEEEPAPGTNRANVRRALAAHGIAPDPDAHGGVGKAPAPRDDLRTFLDRLAPGARLLVLDGLGAEARRYYTGPNRPPVTLDDLRRERPEVFAGRDATVLPGDGRAMPLAGCADLVRRFLDTGRVDGAEGIGAVLVVCPATEGEIEGLRRSLGDRANGRALFIDEYFLPYIGGA